MTNLFKTPKVTKTPPVPTPIATPKDISPQVQRQAADTRRRLLARRGRAGTVLTDEKRTVLG